MKQIYLIITKKCNLSCSFCIRDYSYNENNHLSITEFDLIISKLKNYYDNTNFIISGGEPTVHKNFSYFLKKACENFSKITINTNGTNKYFSTEIFKEIIKDHKIRIQFSIDGYQNVHDKIRGEGNYQRTLNNLKICSGYSNVEVIVSTTVADIDFKDNFSNLYSDLKNYVDVWNIKRVSYSGEANIDKFKYLNNTAWNEIVDNVKSCDIHKIVKINKMYNFNELSNISDDYLAMMESKIIKNCGSGTSKIYIYPNLDVLACTCYEKYPSGNLKTNNLEEILLSSAHKSIIEHTIDHPICNACRYKKMCNGGCLGAGFFSKGSLNIPDIKCPLVGKPTINNQS